jgi:hypothetical protein
MLSFSPVEYGVRWIQEHNLGLKLIAQKNKIEM